MQRLWFYRLGKLIYRGRWPIVILWIAIILGCIPFLPNILSPFKSTGFIDESSKSAIAERKIDKLLGYSNYNKFMIMYHSNTLLAKSAQYNAEIRNSLKDLKKFPIPHEIIYPQDNPKQVAKDKHTAYAVIIVKGQEKVNDEDLTLFKSLLKKQPNVSMQLGGESIFEENVNKQTQTDLYKADFIAAPIALITLILVFGSIVAAIFPILLGGGCALVILTTLYFLGHAFTLSIFTINIALLLGLCLSLDYALFIISRFREELEKQNDIQEAIAITQATAGHAILFSGLAVFASLSALLLFPVNILFSIGVGGLTAVFFSVLMALILLPAILSILDTKINLLSIRIFKHKINFSKGWRWIAETVVGRPYWFFCFTLICLLILSYPFLSVKFGISDYRIFPNHSVQRQFFDTYAKKFDEKELSPIFVSIESKKSKILSKNNIAKLFDYVSELKEHPLIQQISSIVNIDSNINKMQYYRMYNTSVGDAIKTLLATTTSTYLTVITVVSKHHIDSPQTKTLIKGLRNIPAGSNLNVQLSGTPVSNLELLGSISRILPYALIWIMGFTYINLLILLRSVVLPFKAIIMNILSLSASYGVLVLVFQEGYLHTLLNFDPQGMLDISLVVIIFCALFGFSMDYEVFLLSRIREEHELHPQDTKKSIVYGIEKSSGIITSAAIIVIVICFSFLVADVLLVKAFGLGIAVAIFVDAFLIRTIFVPATMAILGKWNWYLPSWLNKILPKW